MATYPFDFSKCSESQVNTLVYSMGDKSDDMSAEDAKN